MKMNKEGSFRGIFIVMTITLLIAMFWDSVSFIKDSAHAILDPTLGVLLAWNLILGMLGVIFVISLMMTLVQKYATDQKTMRELKKEQKALQEEMKKYKDSPEKVAELSKKQFEAIPRMMKLSMRPIIYTAIPIVLLFRWFTDFFAVLDSAKILGMHWLLFYLIASLVFSSILRKIFKVV